MFTRFLFVGLLLVIQCDIAFGQHSYPIAEAWARTKVNAVIFRRNAICTHGDQQVAAFYDAQGRVVLAKRTLGSSQWQLSVTSLQGRTADAHNCICIAFDGDGYLHMSWDHHGNPLRYCRSAAPVSLELQPPEPMLGKQEQRVTYPEFYRMSNGDLLFFYRDGASGNGNLVLNRYDVKRRCWERLHDNLIDGEGERNAYWQVAVARNGHVHLSWVWRETGDVVTNHDIAYAVSPDGGSTWNRTNGQEYVLPINQATAEYAVRIPQDSELANQTSMAVDWYGHPYIANFWRASPSAVPQYRLVWHNGISWKTSQVGQRTLDFHRRGGGTKRPPVSRPLLLLDSTPEQTRAYVLFRDQERGGRIDVAATSDITAGNWSYFSLTSAAVGQADPMVDLPAWEDRREIHLLTQFVGQGDGEKEEDVPPQVISVVTWKPALPWPR